MPRTTRRGTLYTAPVASPVPAGKRTTACTTPGLMFLTNQSESAKEEAVFQVPAKELVTDVDAVVGCEVGVLHCVPADGVRGLEAAYVDILRIDLGSSVQLLALTVQRRDHRLTRRSGLRPIWCKDLRWVVDDRCQGSLGIDLREEEGRVQHPRKGEATAAMPQALVPPGPPPRPVPLVWPREPLHARSSRPHRYDAQRPRALCSAAVRRPIHKDARHPAGGGVCADRKSVV